VFGRRRKRDKKKSFVEKKKKRDEKLQWRRPLLAELPRNPWSLWRMNSWS